MSLFGEYIKERLNKDIVEDENGFATYYFVKDGIYLEDMYVLPSHRKTFYPKHLADKVASIGKEKGFNKMFTTVVPSTNNATVSLKACISYGFKLHSCEQNLIILVKEL